MEVPSKKSKKSISSKSSSKEFNCTYKGFINEHRFRNVFVTICKTKDKTFDGNEQTMKNLINFFNENVIKGNKRDVVYFQQELYDDSENDWHYHIGVIFDNNRYGSSIKKWGELLYDEFPYDIAIEKSNDVKSMVGYIYKDRSVHEPKILGNVDMKYVETCITLWSKKKKDNPAIERDKSMKIARNNEQVLIHDLITFMNEKEVKVNFYTRELIGTSYDEFTEEFQEEYDLVNVHGISAIKKIKTLIADRGAHVLPEWHPDLRYIKFQDCLYNLYTGLKEELNDDITPLYVSTDEFPGKYPKLWLNCLNRSNVDIVDFIESYKFFYQEKKRRDKVLYIWGATGAGKSTIIEPYAELYQGVATSVSEEGNFTLGGIIHYPKVIINEFDTTVLTKSSKNQVKNLFEGNKFKAVKKGVDQQEITPKNVVVTSNTEPIDKTPFGEIDKDLEAINSRLDIYHIIISRTTKNDQEVINKIKREAAAIAVLCTQKSPGLYIKLKKISLSSPKT